MGVQGTGDRREAMGDRSTSKKGSGLQYNIFLLYSFDDPADGNGVNFKMLSNFFSRCILSERKAAVSLIPQERLPWAH